MFTMRRIVMVSAVAALAALAGRRPNRRRGERVRGTGFGVGPAGAGMGAGPDDFGYDPALDPDA